eukprot:CAMPEP_0185701882 /NCGR_PEP_ID=MMETSP1164-20130828/10434_1 /TAXON_ID=1104430 /ORGANISM="Chrysoreinhardia sp, Strain CCMP2950" /LENGTH=331 /DNA_ID=CAMNT_0028369005 /DNA_START=49 /DNA_END=1040 /DNA_ORIENTATION=+
MTGDLPPCSMVVRVPALRALRGEAAERRRGGLEESHRVFCEGLDKPHTWPSHRGGNQRPQAKASGPSGSPTPDSRDAQRESSLTRNHTESLRSLRSLSSPPALDDAVARAGEHHADGVVDGLEVEDGVDVGRRRRDGTSLVDERDIGGRRVVGDVEVAADEEAAVGEVVRAPDERGRRRQWGRRSSRAAAEGLRRLWRRHPRRRRRRAQGREGSAWTTGGAARRAHIRHQDARRLVGRPRRAGRRARDREAAARREKVPVADVRVGAAGQEVRVAVGRDAAHDGAHGRDGARGVVERGRPAEEVVEVARPRREARAAAARVGVDGDVVERR